MGVTSEVQVGASVPDANTKKLLMAGEEPDYPKGFIFVRKCAAPDHFEVPEGNVCEVYLKACQRLHITANTAVATELMRIARRGQDLPYHKTHGKTREEMLQAAFDHLDIDGSGYIEEHELVDLKNAIVTGTHKTMKTAAEEWMSFLDQNADGKVTREEFISAMDFMLSNLDDDEFEAHMLEHLAVVHNYRLLDRREKLTVLFRKLDSDGSGSIELGEFKELSLDMNPKSDLETAKENMDWLDADGDNKVTLEEFLEGMEFFTTQLDDLELDALIRQCLESSHYHDLDLSRFYIGDKGAIALAECLHVDKHLGKLILKGCGIHNKGAIAIANALATHPSCAGLDLSDNPISYSSGDALKAMLESNVRMQDIDIDGTHIRPRHVVCRTHSELGPARYEGGEEFLELASHNAAQPPIERTDVLTILREQRDEVKSVFYSLAGVDGRLTLEELRDGLLDWGAESWGVVPNELVAALTPERIFENDVDMNDNLSYGEFVAYLRREDKRARVAEAIFERKGMVKVLFYDMAGEDGRLSLSEFVEKLRSCVAESGIGPEGWGVHDSHIVEVLRPEYFFESSRGDDHLDDQSTGLLTWGEFWSSLRKMVGIMSLS